MTKTRVHGYENTSLAIECPVCRDFTEKPLAWLEISDHVDCETCGMLIEIEAGPIRAEINRLLERCLQMNAQFGAE